MKTSKYRHSTTVALLLASSIPAFAQLWQTVDTYQLVPGLSANATDIATDPTGALLYSVGSVTPDVEGNRTAVVRASDDHGATWVNLNSYLEAGWNFTHFRGVGTGSNGQVLAAGHLWQPNPGNVVWVVRESIDGGQHWGTTDAFEQTLGGRASCGDIKVSGAGVVFAAGYGGTSSGGSWVVRRRVPGQPGFVTVDAITSSLAGEARSIAFHPTAGVFVAGRVANVWTVRRSLDGVNWTTVDSFKDTQGNTSSAESISVDSAGVLYVAGRANQSSKVKGQTIYLNNWVVRRSTNGGATWTVVDRFGAVASNLNISATGMTMGAGGVIYVAGNTPDFWLVRKGVPGPNGTITWSTSDTYQFAPGQIAFAWGITADLNGNIYAAGDAHDGSAGHWVTRRLTP